MKVGRVLSSSAILLCIFLYFTTFSSKYQVLSRRSQQSCDYHILPTVWRIYYRSIIYCKRFLYRRIPYWANGIATFNPSILSSLNSNKHHDCFCLCGDIHPNPGPSSTECTVCYKSVAKNHRAIACDLCSKWCHIKCGGVTPKEYRQLQREDNFAWTCPPCLSTLTSLPFAIVSLSSDQSMTLDPHEDSDICVLPG